MIATVKSHSILRVVLQGFNHLQSLHQFRNFGVDPMCLMHACLYNALILNYHASRV